MNSYYEKHREDSPELMVQRNSSHVFPAHFHRNVEVYVLEKGEYQLSVNNKTYCLADGQIAFVDSYDVHEYHGSLSEEKSDCVLIFPYEYFGGFNANRRALRVANPIINDRELCSKILEITDKFLCGGESERVKRSASELILTMLFEKLEFTQEKKRDDVALARNILIFLQDNFKGDVSRKALAQEFGYTESHLSRIFHRFLRTGIADYVNGLRLSYVEQMIEKGDDRKILEIIYEAGFNSPQTYYRYKQKYGKS